MSYRSHVPSRMNSKGKGYLCNVLRPFPGREGTFVRGGSLLTHPESMRKGVLPMGGRVIADDPILTGDVLVCRVRKFGYTIFWRVDTEKKGGKTCLY